MEHEETMMRRETRRDMKKNMEEREIVMVEKMSIREQKDEEKVEIE